MNFHIKKRKDHIVLTEVDLAFVVLHTGWMPREGGGKLVVSSSGRRARHEDLGDDPTYYELVLLQQRTLRLALWVEPGRFVVQTDLERKLGNWAPANSHQSQTAVRGQLDGGYAINFTLDIPVAEWVMRLQEVKNIVEAIHERLRQAGIPI